MSNRPKYIIVHTAAAKGEYGIDAIDRWHRQRGFDRVGYHYVIRRDGRVEQGRKEHEVGAHCKDMGMNRQSIGICFEGHHNLEDWTPAQTTAFIDLVDRLIRTYGILSDNVLGHRETGAKKDCPGTRIDMDWVRKIIRFRLPDPMPPKPPTKHGDSSTGNLPRERGEA